MKQLLFAFMLLAAIKSNGQDTTSIYNAKVLAKKYSIDTNWLRFSIIGDTTIRWSRSSFNYYYDSGDMVTKKYGLFYGTFTNWGYLKNGSDTLEIYDSVIELYGRKIRYIKTMNGSIIKL